MEQYIIKGLPENKRGKQDRGGKKKWQIRPKMAENKQYVFWEQKEQKADEEIKQVKKLYPSIKEDRKGQIKYLYYGHDVGTWCCTIQG